MFHLILQLHGGVSKAIKKVFGGGGSSSPKVEYVAPTPVDPVATNVTATEVSTDNADSVKKNRRKKGFTSTLTADTLIGSDDITRSTLG